MIGRSAAKSYAYLLGVYLGDGSVDEYDDNGKYRRLRYTQSAIDLDFIEAVAAAFRCLTTQSVWYRTYPEPRGKPKTCLRCGDEALCAKLQRDTEKKQKIPDYVHSWDADLKLAFIAGLMDSEGFVAHKTGGIIGRSFYMGFKSCDVWVPEFIQILQSVGIRVGKISQEIPRKPSYKVPTRFRIKMQSWVDAGAYFNIRRKQDRVDRWAATEPYSERSRYPRRLSSETTRQTAE
jgi:hypothetical protein